MTGRKTVTRYLLFGMLSELFDNLNSSRMAPIQRRS